MNEAQEYFIKGASWAMAEIKKKVKAQRIKSKGTLVAQERSWNDAVTEILYEIEQFTKRHHL